MEIMNTREVANYLKVSVSTIRRLISKKEIPFFKISNKIFFNKVFIDSWITNQVSNNYTGAEVTGVFENDL